MNKETRVMLVLFALGLQAAQLQCHCRPGYVLQTGQASGSAWEGGCSPSNVTDCACDNGIVVGDEIMRRLVCEQTGGQACVECDAGHQFDSFACVPYEVCPNGTPDADLLACGGCNVGYQLINGNCRPCRSYENWADGTCHNINQVCAAGSEHNGTHCIACASGRFKATPDAGRCNSHTATSTLLCGLGTFQDGSLASAVSDTGCTQCPEGQYQDEFNQPTCKQHADFACVPNIQVEVGDRTSFSTTSCENNTAALQMTSALLASPIARPQESPTSTTDDGNNNIIIGVSAAAGVVLLIGGVGVAWRMMKKRKEDALAGKLSSVKPRMVKPEDEDALLHHIGALRLVF